MAQVDAGQLEDLAEEALTSGEEEAALRRLLPAAERANSARLWQFTGLLQRALDLHSDAVRSFGIASRLAPEDSSIANGHARVALEAGVDAVSLYERAARLAPENGSVLLGLGAAMLAAGRGSDAEDLLDAVIARSPLWIEGHLQLAQLRAMLGKREEAAASIERALKAQPPEERLWTALLNLHVGQKSFADIDEIIGRAHHAGISDSLLLPFEAIAAAESGNSARAVALFDKMPAEARRAVAVWDVRHLLRTGRITEAIGLIDGELDGPRAAQFWPYASIAWRVAADPRWEWLEADGELVSTFDLTDRLPPLDRLADVLRSFHVAAGEYLDQSVRGGTQTDGPLLSRIEPEIRLLREVIVKAVEQYTAQLPPADAAHPTLRERRDRRVRFSGSWSVRLQRSGFHESHVHPQGWISSALYVSLPDPSGGDVAHGGWLKIGNPPPSLGLGLEPTQLIEPKPGRLVLFPSWMWHGTIPFDEGERLSVAFDVRSPN